MTMLRPLAIILRNILMKRHAYFACCASCGDIRTPVEHRLCASLSPDFSVDVVLLPSEKEGHSDALCKATLGAVRKYMPWTRRIWLPEAYMGKAYERYGVHALRPKAGPEGEALRRAGADRFPEHLLHLADDLADYYVVIRDSGVIHHPLLCLDFFTPNGIPLLFAGKPADLSVGQERSALLAAMKGQGIAMEPSLVVLSTLYSQTRENAEDFAGIYERLLNVAGPVPDYCQALAQWSYVSARAVPRARAHNIGERAHAS